MKIILVEVKADPEDAHYTVRTEGSPMFDGATATVTGNKRAAEMMAGILSGTITQMSPGKKVDVDITRIAPANNVKVDVTLQEATEE